MAWLLLDGMVSEAVLSGIPPPDPVDVRSTFDAAPHRLLLIDYDGTPAPIAQRSQDAAPTSELYRVLKRLSSMAEMTVAVISGRTWADSHPAPSGAE
ncbi:MAG: trehalose-phosphatase [Chloroflexota bacterium]|nr:trehalose-phosphatase [Chloroflexota bacterium]